MSDPTSDELRAELASIVDETSRHLAWMKDAGLRTVRLEVEQPSRPSFAPPAVAAPSTGRARPQFLETAPTPKVVPMPPPKPAPTPAAPTIAPKVAKAESLTIIRTDLGDCRRCGLCATRTNLVFGEGSEKAPIVFLGEGPGEDEDTSGRPFVGRAGQLLTKMIEAMGFTRDEVYICNVVKCRPPGNRRPEPDEIEQCRPYFERQLRTIRPQAIVALGATATQSLLNTTTSISRLRNTWQTWEGIPVMPTFHPSYLLRAPNEKAKVWEDLKLVVAKLGRTLPAKK